MADVEILNFNLGFESITTEHHNKKVEVDGIIRTADQVKTELVNAVFKCDHCGTITKQSQGGGKCKLLKPEQCSNKDCMSSSKRTKFVLLQDRSEFKNYQEIWLKPINELIKPTLKLGRGQKVILKDELVGLTEGQAVKIIGKVGFELIGKTTFARPIVIASKIKINKSK